MKFLNGIIIIILASCVNPQSANEPAAEDTEGTSPEIVKEYKPKIKENKTVLSQRDVIMNEAVAISNEFYDNLKYQNYQGANKHMHPDALSVTSLDQWIEIYKKAQEKKGRMAFVKMYDYGAKCGMKGGNGIGDYAELIFDAQYKDGTFREKLTFFRKDSTEAVKILGYEFDEQIERVKIYKGLE